MEVEIWREVKAEPSENPDGIEYEAGSHEDNDVKGEAVTAAGSLDMTEDDLAGNVPCEPTMLDNTLPFYSSDMHPSVTMYIHSFTLLYIIHT